VDFADLESILRDSGDAHIAIGVGTGDNKAEDAVQQVVNSPLLETSINNAGKMLVYILMSADATLPDVDVICAKLTEAAHPDVEVIVGYDFDEALKDTITVTVVATSFRDEAGMSSRDRARKRQDPTPKSEPITEGVEQIQGVESLFETPRGDAFDAFITQSLSPVGADADDPYTDLEKIFGKK
jgi:cell division protein FtsZ